MVSKVSKTYEAQLSEILRYTRKSQKMGPKYISESY